jgi:predicted MFS family arabinose efflux permease
MGAGFNTYLIAPASIIPLFAESFGIDKTAAGLSISVFFLSWGVANLPGGLVMDRRDNRHLVLGGTVVFVGACVATALAPNYTVFLAARLVGGATGAFLWTANANVVSRVFPEERLALGTSLFVASGPVGQAIAQFLGPILANEAGWRTLFFVYPTLAIVGVPILYVAVRDPVRSDEAVSLAQFGRTFRNPTILAVSLASACSFALFLFFNSWMPTYATEELGISIAAAGSAAALVPFAGIVARPGRGPSPPGHRGLVRALVAPHRRDLRRHLAARVRGADAAHGREHPARHRRLLRLRERTRRARDARDLSRDGHLDVHVGVAGRAGRRRLAHR